MRLTLVTTDGQEALVSQYAVRWRPNKGEKLRFFSGIYNIKGKKKGKRNITKNLKRSKAQFDGIFRCTRKSNQIYFFTRENFSSQWKLIFERNWILNDVKIQFGLSNFGTVNKIFPNTAFQPTVELDNFKVNAAQRIIEEDI